MRCKKTVVIGVTGGVAVYKALDIVSRLKKKDIDVHVIMTKAAQEFASELSFRSLSLNPVTTDMFDRPNSFDVEHIALAKRADVLLIAPATANIIGKISNGIADDMLSTTVMATKAPVVIAPAMNTAMYENPIVQRNIENLKSYGYHFIEPLSGRLACGDVGRGKMESPEVIVEYVEMLLHSNKDLKGKNILITAGPTREDIDPVRFISNKSSGKMGYAIARAARDRGANVTLITGPTSLSPIKFIDVVNVYSSEDMYKAVMDNLESADIVIKAAAVSDYSPLDYSSIKIKKSEDSMTLPLRKNKDILLEVGSIKGSRIIVGFAAETNNVLDNAKLKLSKKNLDMIVANDVLDKGSGFDVDTNKISIITNDDIISYDILTKDEAANNILDKILEIKR
ncbi:bifunctional phosphopantothenoylcysteine decarboxylase/phosphopantothenate--cysteine ligase CoaBC [Clostridium cylindrosporum]|uniref:Coenzyme A biosynthesis bifunctional protein CoaBC n=1 Tax=Clostridium cylindrosporum DSM 605 TaxID=1121307 RepID=A0A0J8DAX6_CLOCY|nr:bifunctional phosphopantothenoylcysteine decarboxylase/phosphopantothenate--cysteine ligase CoaBC [Clostridium cylindrosporum]KMT21448.1 putative coenzyme A biosynthesis bifunctional protein CoaBC [Clostridium cylindrosporum DSM 605]